MNQKCTPNPPPYKNIIPPQSTVIDALKMMNEINMNLLVVMDHQTFIGLVSIGDIRRALLEELTLNDTPIEKIMRQDVLIAKENQNLESIKRIMLDQQITCMPVVDAHHQLITIHYWDDLFGHPKAHTPLNVDVVIMAGGRGSRLKPLTNIIPKALVPVGERPIIEIIIDNFKKYHVHNFYISVNYKANMIEEYLRPKESSNTKLHYFTEDQPLGTIGSLHLIRDQLHQTTFVSNCDIIIEEDYADIYHYHKAHNNDITIVTAIKHMDIPYGVIKTGKGGYLQEMIEKPEYTFQVNTGMYLLEPHVIQAIPTNQFYHITELIETIQKKGKVGVFPVAEKAWYDIGQWNEYQTTLNHYP